MFKEFGCIRLEVRVFLFYQTTEYIFTNYKSILAHKMCTILKLTKHYDLKRQVIFVSSFAKIFFVDKA